MFDYIVGKVVEKADNYIVLDNGGFGFLMYVPSPKEFEGREKVFVSLHIKEDSIILYGFKSRQERELFLKLTSIHGIGVKHAFSILSNISVEEFVDAIEREDTALLSSIPGIGKKTAHRLIVELKGKINFQKDRKTQELIDALLSLGYEKSEILQVADRVIGESKTLEDSIKEALILLTKEKV